MIDVNTLRVKVGQLGMVVRLSRPDSMVPLGAIGEVIEVGLLSAYNHRDHKHHDIFGYAVSFPHNHSGRGSGYYVIEANNLLPITPDTEMKEEESSENVKENIKEAV